MISHFLLNISRHNPALIYGPIVTSTKYLSYKLLLPPTFLWKETLQRNSKSQHFWCSPLWLIPGLSSNDGCELKRYSHPVSVFIWLLFLLFEHHILLFRKVSIFDAHPNGWSPDFVLTTFVDCHVTVTSYPSFPDRCNVCLPTVSFLLENWASLMLSLMALPKAEFFWCEHFWCS